MSRVVGRFGFDFSLVSLPVLVLLTACSKQAAPTVSVPAPVEDTVQVAAGLAPGVPVVFDSVSLAEKLVVIKNINTKKTAAFYKLHGYQTRWLLHNQPAPFFEAFETLAGNAGQYGLRSEDYDLAGIRQAVALLYEDNNQDPCAKQAAVAALDVHITNMYFLLTAHLGHGKIAEEKSGRGVWKPIPRTDAGTFDVALLHEALTPEALVSNTERVQPQTQQYLKLQQALAFYRALEKHAPAAVEITKGVKVKPEEHHAMIPLIRRKLSLTDMKVYPMPYDSTAGTFDSLRYDSTLVAAVKWFQSKHGLEADGIIGERTLRFMNQSFREKADIIALNMERLRWTREKYQDDFILVNVPAYTMYVYEKQKPALQMRVIVGAVDTPTPIFSDAIEHIVFSPTWTVPTSIIKGEILPRLRSNPTYYSGKQYSFYKGDVAIDPALEPWDSVANPYQYRVVQQPGPDNSLGLVKFVMPNNMSVYLHDTPNHRLFQKDYRALSHGCVRLDEPALFASYLLREHKGWDDSRIRKAMHAAQPSTIILKKKLDVHIDYFTAWVDENDTVQFRDDIYGHDRRQLLQLFPKEKMSDVAGL